MHKLLAAVLIASTAIGAFSAPAYADRLSISISDDGDRHHRGHWNRHHGAREHWNRGYHRSHWKQHSYYHARPIILHNSYVMPHYQPASYYVPQMPVAQQDSRYCREYNGPANVGGRVVQTYGTACLMPDGSWQIMD